MRRLRSMVDPTLETRNLRYFTADGQLMEPSADYAAPAHNFAPLSEDFGRFVMFSGSVFLTRCATAAAYVGFQLDRMKDGADVVIHENADWVRERARLTIDDVVRTFPSVQVEPLRADKWYRLTAGSGLGAELDRLPTMYPRFVVGFPSFREAVTAVAPPPTDHHSTAEGRFIAQLGRLISDSAFFAPLFKEQFGTRAVEGLDVGGGLGFLACELAAAGHRARVVDIDRIAIEAGGPALARACEAEDRVEYAYGSMTDLESLEGTQPKYDYVSFLGSLLLPPRDVIPEVLRSAMRLVRPGGLLIVKESPLERERGRPDNTYSRFSADELHRLLVENAGEPVYYNAFTAAEVPLEEARKDLLFAVVQKR